MEKFYVYENIGTRDKFRFQVIGIFPEGVHSILAVPYKYRRVVSEEKAKEWVEYLNQMDKDNLIDWAGSEACFKD